MSPYQYLPLPSEGDYIRLLCLLPNESEAEPLQCKLHNYSLRQLGRRTHQYEALSYVWGDPRETLPIYIDKEQFLVTVNLHAALSRLRGYSFERIIWVDAVCIDQKNLKEQGQQVQLMAKIYSNAYCVIAWLGEETKDTDGALEGIRLAANEELIERSKKERNQQAILSLLQRPWFQRIWVLQEVAAARRITIMCGSVEIDGYVFCLGVNSLKLSSTASPELYTLPSVIYLIERAGLRSKHIANLPERFSLNIRCLAELIDMFHTRKASNIRDKVYALLGMSSDNPDEAGLQPDYEISWKELFQRLVKFILGKDVFVETSDCVQRAVIKSKGCILGQVSSVRIDDKQNVNITFISKNTTWCFGDQIKWTLQTSAKSIQERDVVCLLEGASKPTIIRLCKDHSAILVIAVTPLKESRSFEQLELSKSITRFPHDFLIIWDWEQLLGESQDQEELKNLVPVDEGTGIWNIALILEELEEYEEAQTRIREAIRSYEMALGKESSYLLKSQYSLTPLSWAAGTGYNAIVNLLLAKDNIDPDLKDKEYSRTPLSWAAQYGHAAVVKLLLGTGKVEVDSKDKEGRTPLSWAARNGHEAIVKLLLETGKIEANSKDKESQTPLWWATDQGHVAVIKLLLETGKVEANSKDNQFGQTLLSWAAYRGHEAVVKLLLETGKIEANSKDKGDRTPLWWAADQGHEAVVKLLLETGKVEADSKDSQGRTPLSWAAYRGHEAVVKLLLETGKIEANSKDNQFGRTPLSWATFQGHAAIVKLLLETGKIEANSKDNQYGRTPLLWAARNGHEAIVKLLLETGKVEVDSKDKEGRTPLSWAARNGHEAVVKLLLETSKIEANSKDKGGRTPLLWAARNGYEAIVKLLLETGKVEANSKDKEYSRTPLLWAARNGHEVIVKLLLETGKVEANSKDKGGRTPLWWATDQRHAAIVKLLRETVN